MLDVLHSSHFVLEIFNRRMYMEDNQSHVLQDPMDQVQKFGQHVTILKDGNVHVKENTLALA